MPFSSVGGVRLHALEIDEGGAGSPAVLFLHRAGGGAQDWTPVLRRLRALERGFRALALDLPGHGRSAAAAEEPATLARYARLVAEWADAIALPRAVLVGHSMGCAIAVELALLRPAFVAGLVLVGGALRFRIADSLRALLRERFALAERKLAD